MLGSGRGAFNSSGPRFSGDELDFPAEVRGAAGRYPEEQPEVAEALPEGAGAAGEAAAEDVLALLERDEAGEAGGFGQVALVEVDVVLPAAAVGAEGAAAARHDDDLVVGGVRDDEEGDAAGAQDAGDLLQAAHRVLDVLQRVLEGDDVEGGVREWEPGEVAQLGAVAALAAELHGEGGAVDAGGVEAQGARGFEHVAGGAADVEDGAGVRGVFEAGEELVAALADAVVPALEVLGAVGAEVLLFVAVAQLRDLFALVDEAARGAADEGELREVDHRGAAVRLAYGAAGEERGAGGGSGAHAPPILRSARVRAPPPPPGFRHSVDRRLPDAGLIHSTNRRRRRPQHPRTARAGRPRRTRRPDRRRSLEQVPCRRRDARRRRETRGPGQGHPRLAPAARIHLRLGPLRGARGRLGGGRAPRPVGQGPRLAGGPSRGRAGAQEDPSLGRPGPGRPRLAARGRGRGRRTRRALPQRALPGDGGSAGAARAPRARDERLAPPRRRLPQPPGERRLLPLRERRRRPLHLPGHPPRRRPEAPRAPPAPRPRAPRLPRLRRPVPGGPLLRRRPLRPAAPPRLGRLPLRGARRRPHQRPRQRREGRPPHPRRVPPPRLPGPPAPL